MFGSHGDKIDGAMNDQDIAAELTDRTNYNVVPGRGNWRVEENGIQVDTASSQSQAKRKAKSMASQGDSIIIHDANGAIQDRMVI